MPESWPKKKELFNNHEDIKFAKLQKIDPEDFEERVQTINNSLKSRILTLS